MKTTSTSSSIARPVWKWLQSLDLGYVLHNLKHELSNGVVVAEILSRYPVHDARGEHLYFDAGRLVDGHAAHVKQGNWEQLTRFCRRHGIPVLDATLVEAVLFEEPGAAPALMTRLHHYFTQHSHGRRLNPWVRSTVPVGNPLQCAGPSFAQPTVSHLIRTSRPKAEDILHPDQWTYQKRAELIVQSRSR